MDGFQKSSGRFRGLGLILFLALIILAIAYGAYMLFFIPPPVIEGKEEFNYISASKTVTLQGRNISSINISLTQDGRRIELLRDSPEYDEKVYSLQIKPKELGLADGPATVIIKARSGILKSIEYKISSLIDTVPPDLEVLKAPPVIYRGSGAFAILRARDAKSVFIKLKEHVFRAFEAPSGIEPELTISSKEVAKTYFVFFPAPFSIKEGVFYAVAEDIAGNQRVLTLPTRLRPKKYRRSSINISDSFINTVISPMLGSTDITDPVSAFKKVNEEWRADVHKKITQIAHKTETEIFWKGRFLQLRNSKVMATYGDERTYYYKGKPISRSVHLGYDLASVANAPVEAANTGIVRFAGDLGIYGNTVIIDHGMGLMSLYGHLSMIMAREGQAVKKGDVIGQTGSTGLAGGDHLHFGILIHGYEVSPLYWWYPHWIKVNVLDYMEYVNSKK